MTSFASFFSRARKKAIVLWGRTFQVHWYTGDDAVQQGLVGWQLSVTAPRHKNAIVQVSLRLKAPWADDASAPLHEEQIVLDGVGKATRMYAAHTQLLPEGQAMLRATWRNAAGVVICLQDIAVDTKNQPGVGQITGDALRRAKVPFLGTLPCDSSHYPYDDTAVQPWFDQVNALEQLEQRIQQGFIQARLKPQFEQFVREGWMVFEGLLDEDLIAAVNKDLDLAIKRQHEGYQYGSSQRIEGLHRKPGATRNLFFSRAYLNILDQLYGAPARPCQTLGYVFGSQQDAHQDAIHLTPFPAGYMNGVWIALQDVQPGSGELVIYPGSHRFPRMYMQPNACAKVDDDWTEFGQKVVPQWAKMIEASGIEAQIYRPKKGAILIWHENLMHGGSVRVDAHRERRSMVIHTFAQGAVAYYDSSGKVGQTEAAQTDPIV